jgi:hypothetical protein
MVEKQQHRDCVADMKITHRRLSSWTGYGWTPNAWRVVQSRLPGKTHPSSAGEIDRKIDAIASYCDSHTKYSAPKIDFRFKKHIYLRSTWNIKTQVRVHDSWNHLELRPGWTTHQVVRLLFVVIQIQLPTTKKIK